MRRTFFDFEAIEVSRAPRRRSANSSFTITWAFRAEEAASYQAMGFFERLLEVGDAATSVTAKFTEMSWKGDPDHDVLILHWRARG